MAGLLAAGTEPGIAFGMGRSYGDVALNPGGRLWMARGLDRFIHFDDATGVLSCEAGVLLRDIQRLFVPRGWMLPVTPGTWWVTLGGAIANDVHGKNHHVQGSFGDHVLALTLARSGGEEMACSRAHNSDWLAATLGGLGLTGVVTTVTLQLRRVEGPWLQTDTVPFDSLTAFFQLADESASAWEYTVAWIDCLSGARTRGIFSRARHAPLQKPSPGERRPLGVPFELPLSLVNRYSLRLFNQAYYRMQRWRAGESVQHYIPFFYPLDSIGEWNRIYGPRGFYQYQCVLPVRDREAATATLLDEIRAAGEGSFLTVLKTFADREPAGMLSFPQAGVTLAMDFPNRGDSTLALLGRLDSVVAAAGGRIYPAKDARMSREMFEAGYPALPRFLPYRDPGMSSALSRRLLGS